MKTLTITCNNCGGGLTPPNDARYITCSFCGTRLEICQEGNTYFSRTLETLVQDTAKISGDLDVIKIQNEIERLDREWSLEREKYLIRHKNGTTSEPGESVVTFLFLGLWVAMGVIMTAILMKSREGGIIALFPIGITLIGVMGVLSNLGKSEAYQTAHKSYQNKRTYLLQKLPSGLGLK